MTTAEDAARALIPPGAEVGDIIDPSLRACLGAAAKYEREGWVRVRCYNEGGFWVVSVYRTGKIRDDTVAAADAFSA